MGHKTGSRLSRKGKKGGKSTGGADSMGEGGVGIVMRPNNLAPTDKLIFRGVSDSQIYTVVRNVQVSALLTASNSADVFAAFQFTPSMIDDFSSIAAVFDQYRIDLLQLDLTFRGNTASGSVGTWVFGTVIDYDDGNAPSSFGQLLDYSNYIESRLTASFDKQVRTFVPAIAAAAYTTGAAVAGYGMRQKQWMDCTYSAVPHYGVKAGIRQNTSSAVPIVDGLLRVRLSLRNSR